MTRVLLVEDERSLLESLERGLKEQGYEVIPASSIGEAREALSEGPDLILLDLMLPDVRAGRDSGVGGGIDVAGGQTRESLAVLRDFREEGIRQLVLVLTVRDSVAARVQLLDAGADDLLVKPFSLDELYARLRALRRRIAPEQSHCLSVEGLEVDLLRRTTIRVGRPLALSNRLFELLVYLMQHAHSPVTREMIARDVLQDSTANCRNLIAVHIRKLRQKIERPGLPTILHTVQGKGYQLGSSR